MKDRVENLLKLAREHLFDDYSEMRGFEITGLKEELLKILDDDALEKKLNDEWADILYQKRLANWDEKFLKVIAGEESVTTIKPSSGFGQAPIKGQGQQVTYPTVTATGTTLNLANNATAATWASTVTQKELDELRDEVYKLTKDHEAKMVKATFKPIRKE